MVMSDPPPFEIRAIIYPQRLGDGTEIKFGTIFQQRLAFEQKLLCQTCLQEGSGALFRISLSRGLAS
jgi:hypothetical protein